MLDSHSRCNAAAVTAAAIIALIGLLHSGPVKAQDVVDLALGNEHACTLAASGQTACLAEPNAGRFMIPDDSGPYLAITAGLSHSCGIHESGAIRCFGDNGFGQLDVPALEEIFVSIDAGDNHTCAISDAANLVCWGENGSGQTEPPDSTGALSVAGGYQQVSAGFIHSCGVKLSGELVCWGGGSADAPEIQVPQDGKRYTQVEASRMYSCGLDDAGIIDCWGQSPPPLAGRYTELAASSQLLCALDEAGGVECTGFIEEGAGTQLASSVKLAAGLSQAVCGVSVDGQVDCLGSQVPSIPGDSSISLPSLTGFRAFVYSDTTAEFWWSPNGLPATFSGFEIFRDGQLLTFTSNGASFLDDTLLPNTSYEYRVRPVGNDGRIGDLSDPIVFNTTQRGEVTDGQGPYTEPQRVNSPTALEAIILPTRQITLDWQSPETPNLAGFEIRRNQLFIGYTEEPPFDDDDAPSGVNYHYDVIAVDDSGQILNFAGVDAAPDYAPRIDRIEDFFLTQFIPVDIDLSVFARSPIDSALLFSLDSDSPSLASGLSLSDDGRLSGIPQENEEAPMSIRVTDEFGNSTDSVQFVLLIANNTPPVFSGSPLGALFLDGNQQIVVDVSQEFSDVDEGDVLSFSLGPNSVLSSNVSFEQDGKFVIAGTSAAASAIVDFVRATDLAGNQVESGSFSISKLGE